MRIARASIYVSLAVLAGCGSREAPAREAAIERPWPELVRVALGTTFSCVIDHGARVQCWGDVPSEIAGHEVLDRLRSPHTIPRMTSVHELASDHDTLCARTSERRVLCWGPDVHGDGEREHPVELGPLAGATSIAVLDERVCGLVDDQLRCVGTNQPRIREALPRGAWLAAVGDAVCALDGRGPARCVESGGTTFWPITGSEGAVSISLASGVCATTADHHLRCDDDALVVVEASLREVDGMTDARFVRGTRAVRCVAREDAIVCASGAEDDTRFEGAAAALDVGASRALDRTREHGAWHACALVDGAVSCAGVNQVGEVTGHAPAPVQRIRELEGARPALAVFVDHAWLVGPSGALVRVPFDDPEASVEDTRATGWLDLAKCEHDRLCGRGEGDRLLAVHPDHARAPRIVSGFVATGTPFPASGFVCAPSEAGTVCVDDEDHVTRLDALASPISFEDQLCGLRAGSVVCAPPPRFPAMERALEPLTRVPQSPTDLTLLFGGAEQLFAQRRGGVWVAMGHNGVGQLGLAPSVPVSVPTTTSASAFTRMGFAYHLSCGWNESGAIVCAGLDDALRPRVLPMRFGFFAAAAADRGDGLWRAIPSVADVVAMDSSGEVSCALDARGGLWCWGGPSGGAGPRRHGPTVVTLAEE